MKKVIAYDLDGTLFSLKKTVQVFNRETNTNKKICDIKEYSFAKVYGISSNEEVNIWKNFSSEIIAGSTVNERLVLNLIEEAKENDIIIVTARDKVYRNLNRDILKHYNIPFTDIVDNVFDKYESLKKINAHKFYDDRGELIEELSKTDLVDNCELILVDAPYNQKIPFQNRYYLY